MQKVIRVYNEKKRIKMQWNKINVSKISIYQIMRVKTHIKRRLYTWIFYISTDWLVWKLEKCEIRFRMIVKYWLILRLIQLGSQRDDISFRIWAKFCYIMKCIQLLKSLLAWKSAKSDRGIGIEFEIAAIQQSLQFGKLIKCKQIK